MVTGCQNNVMQLAFAPPELYFLSLSSTIHTLRAPIIADMEVDNASAGKGSEPPSLGDASIEAMDCSNYGAAAKQRGAHRRACSECNR